MISSPKSRSFRACQAQRASSRITGWPALPSLVDLTRMRILAGVARSCSRSHRGLLAMDVVIVAPDRCWTVSVPGEEPVGERNPSQGPEGPDLRQTRPGIRSLLYFLC